jgi:hypothetical protein
MINTAPFDAFEPSFERYFNLHRFLVRSLDDHAVDRSSSIGRLSDLAQELLGERAVRRLQWLVTILFELDLLQLHGKVRGSGRAKNSLEPEDKAVIR